MTLGAVELIGTAVSDRAVPIELAEIAPPAGACGPFISAAVRACGISDLRSVPMVHELGADEAAVRTCAGGEGTVEGEARAEESPLGLVGPFTPFREADDSMSASALRKVRPPLPLCGRRFIRSATPTGTARRCHAIGWLLSARDA